MSVESIVTQFAADLSNWTSGVARMQADYAQLQKRTSEFNAAASTAGKSIGGVFNTLTSPIRAVGGAILETGRNFISGVASVGQWVFWTKQLASAAVGLVGGFLSANATLEQQRIAFTGLLHSGSAADSMLRQLQAFAAATPFEFTELTTDTQQLIGMGFAARDVIPILTAVGDAAAGVGAGQEGVNRITLALGQMQARAQVTGGDMLQLTQAGIPAWRILAESMHLSVAQVQELSQKGQLGADAVTALWHGMEHMYGGQMAGQATTFNGLLSTLHDNAQMALMAFAGPAFNLAKGALTQLTTLMGSPAVAKFAADMGARLGTAITNVIGFFQRVIPPIVSFFTQVEGGKTKLQVLGEFLQTRLIAPLGRLGDKVGPLIAQFIAWGNQTGIFSGILSALGGIILGTIAGVGAIADGMARFIGWMQQGSAPAQLVAAAMVALGVAIAGIAIANLIAAIPALIAGIAAWGVTAWTAAAGMIALTWPVLAVIAAIALLAAAAYLIVRNWGPIMAWMTTAWNNVKTFFVGLWASIVSLFHSATNTVRSGVVSWLTGLGAFVVGAMVLLLNAFTLPIRAIVALFVWLYNHNYYFKQLIDTIRNVVVAGLAWLQQAWTTVINFIVNLWHGWVGLASAIWGLVVSIITSRVNSARSSVTSAFNAVASFLSGIWNTIRTGATNVWNTVVSIFAGIWGRVSGPLNGFLGSVRGFFGGMASQAFTWGSNIINGIINGIKSMIGNLISTVSNAAGQVAKFLGFHSPTEEGPGRYIDTWGVNMMATFANSIRRGQYHVDNALDSVLSPMTGSLALGVSGGLRSSSGGVATRPQVINVIMEVDGRAFASAMGQPLADEVRLRLGRMR
jgi:tape measure domain-containing protein